MITKIHTSTDPTYLWDAVIPTDDPQQNLKSIIHTHTTVGGDDFYIAVGDSGTVLVSNCAYSVAPVAADWVWVHNRNSINFNSVLCYDTTNNKFLLAGSDGWIYSTGEGGCPNSFTTNDDTTQLAYFSFSIAGNSWMTYADDARVYVTLEWTASDVILDTATVHIFSDVGCTSEVSTGTATILPDAAGVVTLIGLTGELDGNVTVTNKGTDVVQADGILVDFLCNKVVQVSTTGEARALIANKNPYSSTLADTICAVGDADGMATAWVVPVDRCTVAGDWYRVSVASQEDLLDVNFDFTGAQGKKTFWAVGGQSAVKIYPAGQSVTQFSGLTPDYRCGCFTVLDGYVFMGNLLVWNDSTKKWDWYKRGIVWSSPGTYNDFTGVGSGFGELPGIGQLLDMITLQHTMIIFEENCISALTLTGQSDPEMGPIYSYRKISENMFTICNPVVVGDICYFINNVGLLCATEGVTVQEVDGPFDISEYFDTHDKLNTVIMVYSKYLRCFFVYQITPDSTEHRCFIVNPETGAYTSYSLPHYHLDGNDLPPLGLVQVIGTDNPRGADGVSLGQFSTLISYGAKSGETTLATTYLQLEDVIRGVDEVDAGVPYHRRHADVQTGEISMIPPGAKAVAKEIWVRAYNNGSADSGRPVLAVATKPMDEKDWIWTGDSRGALTITGTSVTGSGTALSNDVALGDGGTTDFTLPCLASKARVYLGTTLQTRGTDYTLLPSTSAYTIRFTAAPTSAQTVIAYWSGEPQVSCKIGDILMTDYGFHYITAVNFSSGNNCLTLSWYPSQFDASLSGVQIAAKHITGRFIEAGDSIETVYPVNQTINTTRFRFVVVPRNSNQTCTNFKLLGFSTWYVPGSDRHLNTGT